MRLPPPNMGQRSPPHVLSGLSGGRGQSLEGTWHGTPQPCQRWKQCLSPPRTPKATEWGQVSGDGRAGEGVLQGQKSHRSQGQAKGTAVGIPHHRCPRGALRHPDCRVLLMPASLPELLLF